MMNNSEIRRFVIANDHSGVRLKEKIIDYLSNKYQIIDLGTNDEEVPVDYSSFAIKSVQMSQELNCECILICGTGIGVTIAANKIVGVRAANLYNSRVARLAKEHNNANVICFGAREFKFDEVKKMLNAFIKAKFQGDRHQKRIDIISIYENSSKNSKKK